jgi:hypothetical protein
VFGTDHADGLASHDERDVEHGGDAERFEIVLPELCRARVRARLTRFDEPEVADGIEVRRIFRRGEHDAPVAELAVRHQPDAGDLGAVGVVEPHRHTGDTQGFGQPLYCELDRGFEVDVLHRRQGVNRLAMPQLLSDPFVPFTRIMGGAAPRLAPCVSTFLGQRCSVVR